MKHNIEPGELTKDNFRNTEGYYIQILPFYNCSVGCNYCFTYSKLNSDMLISPKEMKKLLQKLDTETKNASILSLSFLGGELTESDNFYKYLDIINEVFNYRKDNVRIEMLSNLNGSLKQYEYFFKTFSGYDDAMGVFTLHNQSIFGNKIEQFEKKLTYFQQNNYRFDITFLQGTDSKYQKEVQKNENDLITLNPSLKKEIEKKPIINCILEGIKGGVDFKKINVSTKKVMCHANYFCIRPEGISNECVDFKIINFEEFLTNGFKKIKKILICRLSECGCFPDLRNIVGFTNLLKDK